MSLTRSFYDQFLSCSCLQFLNDWLTNPCLVPDFRNDDFAVYLAQFEQLSYYNDPYFGECYLLRHLTSGDLIVVRKERHPAEQTFRLSENRNRQLTGLRNSHIVNLLEVDGKVEEGFLFDEYKLALVYEYIFVDLEKEMDNRLLEGRPYDQQEIMLVMTQCIHGLYYLESRRVPHAAIRPRYLYISRNHQMKVGYRDLFQYESNYDCIRNNRGERHIYLAPEEVEDLGHGMSFPSNPEWKSNVFSFGMIILSMMSASWLDTAYDYGNCLMRRQRINEAMKESRLRYSDRLLNIVQAMLADLNNRTTFEALAQRLISTSGRPVEITLLEGPSPKDVGVPFYSFERPQRSDPASYPNNLSRLMFPATNNNTSLVSKRTRQGMLFDVDARSNLSMSTNMKVPMNNRLQYANGSVFMGEDYNPLTHEKQGRGLYKLPSGQWYMGDWRDNRMEGRGILYWTSEYIRYEGEFSNDMFHGKGVEYPQIHTNQAVPYTNITITPDNWVKYDGEFVQDMRHGKGIIYFDNGWWEGNFKGGQPDGEGVWHPNSPLDPVISGIWSAGTYSSWVGQAPLTM